MNNMEQYHRSEALRLAAERGLAIRTLADVEDYARRILAPRGLASWDQICEDWREARRLLGMLPPARG